MNEVEPKKKGMSKGCLIALIIGIVFVVLVIAAALTCYLKREDVAKFGASTVLTSIKTMVADQGTPGVDTVRFNAVVDNFMEKLDAEPLDGERFSEFFTEIQPVPSDGAVDSLEAQMVLEAMFNYYPELKDLYPVEEVPDTAAAAESF
ncbi:MAG: hypothetical protein JSW34_02885 [Candidatus Zixiibacteriota bacterium]|nr:MAG: hypothetical protein JSW34_02885 [candidate division Zixibacteria bacterium]